MTTAGAAPDPVFVETNILVYANVVSSPWNVQATRRLAGLAASGVTLWTSRQVLREYLSTLSRPQTFTNPIAPNILAADIVRFEAQFQIAEDSSTVTANLLALLQAYPTGGKQVYDANIVATMQAHGLTQLLTHNAADFARFVPLITVMPL